METTELLSPDMSGIARAADILRAGRLVAFPTETVYGLGADATNDDAVARIFSVKNRPTFNPLIVHVDSLNQAERFARFDDLGRRLAETFWPGPLTLVLPMHEGSRISKLATAGSDMLAIRVPNGGIAQQLLANSGRPIAAPSANPSGQLSPTSSVHVLKGLGGRIAAIIEGGACEVGIESTVLVTGREPAILRPGGLAKDDLEHLAGRTFQHAQTGKGPASPGQLLSHYAPRSPLRINADAAETGEVFLGFGENSGDYNLSETGDLVEAAANLFRMLHLLDQSDTKIAVAPVPEHGLGIAINDRLRRAATPA